MTLQDSVAIAREYCRFTVQESVAIAREYCRFTRERSGRWGGSSPRETGKTPTPPAQRRCPVTAVSTVSATATAEHGVNHLTRLSHSCKHQSTIQCRRTLAIALKMSESAIHLFINCTKVLVCCYCFQAEVGFVGHSLTVSIRVATVSLWSVSKVKVDTACDRVL